MKNAKHLSSIITLVIIEDHPIFQDGLVKLFELENDFYVVETATHTQQGLKAILKHQPAVVILDINLPDGNGLDLAKRIKADFKNTAVIILTYHENDYLIHAINAGASAYCHKSISADELLQVVRKVVAGYYYLEGRFMNKGEVDKMMSDQVNGLLRPYIKNARQHENTFLSPRERDILKSVIQGKSNKEISQQLHISQQTVKNHMTSILSKLDVRDRTQAVITAIRHGWVNVNDEFLDL